MAYMLFFPLLVFSTFLPFQVYAHGAIDIHTGIPLSLMHKPSTGLPEPKNHWARQCIAAIEDGNYALFRELLDQATFSHPGCSSIFFSSSELLDTLLYHQLGDRTTMFDIACKSSHHQIKEDMRLLRIISAYRSDVIALLDEMKQHFNK